MHGLYKTLVWYVLPALLLPAAQTAVADGQTRVGLNKAEVTAIAFKLAPDNLKQFNFALPEREITEQVGKNLAEWQFPIKLDAGTYSHVLTAKLGPITHDSTPAGLSFSLGNADPRAQDFQKADVLPISCRLTSATNPNISVEEHSTFNTFALTGDTTPAKATANLTDDISTLCFNLLDGLKLPLANKPVEAKTFKPSWAPQIQVEVKQVKPAAVEAPDPGQVDNHPVIEQQQSDEEGRKQLLIRNQGAPVILQFGHERR